MNTPSYLDDIRFLLNEVVAFSASVRDPEWMTTELAMSIIEEAGKFAAGVLAPLNASGDQTGLALEDGKVTTPDGFAEAWQQMCANGWNNMAVSEAAGGQGLPWMVTTLITEMFSQANKAFTMCPGLTLGAIEAIEAAAPDHIKHTFLPKLVSGQWTGTMNLTEPQAGSDVGAIRASAVAADDGSYRIKGQKIFISFGEHDMASNIVHLVLARLPDAPAGVSGISLFLVPKFLVNSDGSLGDRNDVVCTALEHKLGIHASPTAVMSFGDQDGAVGYLIGEPNRGLGAMFVMMNMARLAVGIEGVASAESATDLARRYAFERVQGSSPDDPSRPVCIAEHMDVGRMLMQMTARTRAMRLMALVIAEAQDNLVNQTDPLQRQSASQFINLMIPVFKGWATESGVDIASMGIQIHGGMGYVEETGAAQIWRDARISPIYEGTTGIQANDLVCRKLYRDRGEAFQALIARMQLTCADADEAGFRHLASLLQPAVEALADVGRSVIDSCDSNIKTAQFVSVPFLMMMGQVSGGWLLVRAALQAQACRDTDRYANELLDDWIQSAEFYCRSSLAEASGLGLQITNNLASEESPLPDITLLQRGCPA